MTDVVWAEESKNGLRFEIRPSYDDAPTTSLCQADGQSSCTSKWSHLGREELIRVFVYHPFRPSGSKMAHPPGHWNVDTLS